MDFFVCSVGYKDSKVRPAPRTSCALCPTVTLHAIDFVTIAVGRVLLPPPHFTNPHRWRIGFLFSWIFLFKMSMILLFCNEKAQSFIFWNCAIQILAHIKVFYVYLNRTEFYCLSSRRFSTDKSLCQRHKNLVFLLTKIASISMCILANFFGIGD